MLRRAAPFCVVALAVGGAPGYASLPARIDVRAKAIGLYPGASPVVVADGATVAHVGVRLVRADALWYDLERNRLIASGHVVVSVPRGDLRAAAYALDVATGDATALRLDGALPQTLLLRGDDVQGSVGPPASGAFDVWDLAGQKPFVRGPHAVIVPNATVRFAPAHVLTDVGAAVPSPAYLYSFSTNPSFAQQSLPGSTFDQPYGLFGTPSSLASLHFVFDQGSGLGVGLDLHLVDRSKSYAVASVLPMTGGGRFDLIGFEQLTPVMSQQLTGSHQTGFDSVQYQLLHNESASVTALTLLAVGGLQTADLRVSSLSHLIPHLFSYKFTAGVGYDHQSGMLPYPSDSRATLGALFTLPPLRAPFGVSYSSSLNLAETIYDYPRVTGSTVFANFFSKQVAPAVRLIGQIQFVQVFDRYRTGQSFFYPPQTVTLPDGTVYYGYAAYNGSSTTRTYSLGATYTPNANFNLQLALTHNRDFPQYGGFGNPPYSLGFDVRVRPRGGPSLEFGRSYIFDWGGRQFSPAYTLSVAP